MTMSDPKRSGSGKVWVVMFDSIERPDPDPVFNEADPPSDVLNGFTAFDDLEVCSTYFEQYVVQNVASAGTDCDRLGGLESVKTLIRMALNAGLSPFMMELLPRGISASPELPGGEGESFSDVAKELGVTSATFEIDSSGTIPADLAKESNGAASSSSLIWFTVRNCGSGEPEKFREPALRQIVLWHQTIPLADRPILIVTGLIGVAKPIEHPLETGVDEGLMGVPLWIDLGARHPRRIQTLAGSFDLIPTIAECLGLCVSSARPDDSAGAAPGLSLLPLCGVQSLGVTSVASVFSDRSDDPAAKSTAETNPQTSFERRVLRLVGDDWTGLRAQQYLLIHRGNSEVIDEEFPAEGKRQLFLKPDDVWNISDVIVSYDAIADEMETQAGLAS